MPKLLNLSMIVACNVMFRDISSQSLCWNINLFLDDSTKLQKSQT